MSFDEISPNQENLWRRAPKIKVPKNVDNMYSSEEYIRKSSLYTVKNMSARVVEFVS